MNVESKHKIPDSIDTVADVVRLCLFAKEATNMDDEFSKGMLEAFDYIIMCCSETQTPNDTKIILQNQNRILFCMSEILKESSQRVAIFDRIEETNERLKQFY